MSEPEDEEEEDNHKEQHEVLKEHRKRKEFEVFVGGLDKDATESDIRKAFSEAGELKEVRLLTNPITKKNKGFAFLRFATVEQARWVVSDFKNPLVCSLFCFFTASLGSKFYVWTPLRSCFLCTKFYVWCLWSVLPEPKLKLL
jgi:RNA recognition motif-containing protein